MAYRASVFPIRLAAFSAATLLGTVDAAAQISSVPRPLPSDPLPTLILDTNGDGVDELISWRGTSSLLEAFRVAADGELVLERVLSDVPVSPQDLAMADMDGDGRDDLVSLEPSPAFGAVFIGLYFDRGGPSFEFETVTVVTEPDDKIALTDFDGDGDTDIILYPKPRNLAGPAFTTPSTIRWVENLGAGVFEQSMVITSTVEAFASAQPMDLDQDGDLDFALIRDSESGELALARNVGQSLVIEGVASSETDYVDLEVGDVNGDGVEDVMGLRGGLSPSDQIMIELYVGTAAGSLGAPTPVLSGISNLLPDLSLLDIDGDADLDLAVTTRGSATAIHRIALFEGDGAGSFGAVRFTGNGEGAALAHGQAGDLNGDGRADMLHEVAAGPGVAAVVRLGGEDAFGALFGAGTTSGRVGPGRETLVVDLDGDGVSDLLLPRGFELSWARGLVDGVSYGRPALLDVQGAPQFGVNLDADAAEELVLYRSSTDELVLLDSIGGGVLGVEVALGEGGPAFKAETLQAVDLDGDGDLDFTAELESVTDLVWFENQGGLVFGSAVPLGLDQVGLALDFDLGDFNGDGEVDVLSKSFIFFPNLVEMYAWHEGLGGGVFGPRQIVGSGGDRTTVVDVDGDGADDLLWMGIGNISWTPGSSLGFGLPDGSALISGAVGEQILGLADYDGDGLKDILTFTDTAQVLGYRALDSTPTFSSTAFELAPARDVSSPDRYSVQLADTGSDFDLDLLIGSTVESCLLYENVTNGAVGQSFCGPAVPNSTGVPSQLLAAGSPVAQSDELRLRAVDLPQNAFGFFIVSQTQVPATPVIGSSGSICLGGSVGRYVGPGQVQSSGIAGSFSLELDLDQIPQPNGFVPAAAGSMWSFQAWHRDASASGPTSNFSSGLSVVFQ